MRGFNDFNDCVLLVKKSSFTVGGGGF